MMMKIIKRGTIKIREGGYIVRYVENEKGRKECVRNHERGMEDDLRKM